MERALAGEIYLSPAPARYRQRETIVGTIIKLACVCMVAGLAALPVTAVEDIQRRPGGISVFGRPVAGPKRVFAPDRTARMKARPAVSTTSPAAADPACPMLAPGPISDEVTAQPLRHGRKPCS